MQSNYKPKLKDEMLVAHGLVASGDVFTLASPIVCIFPTLYFSTPQKYPLNIVLVPLPTKNDALIKHQNIKKIYPIKYGMHVRSFSTYPPAKWSSYLLNISQSNRIICVCFH